MRRFSSKNWGVSYTILPYFRKNMQYHTITADPKPDPHARQQIEAYVEHQFPAIFDRTQVEKLSKLLEKPVESLRTSEPRRRTSSFVRNGTAAFSIT